MFWNFDIETILKYTDDELLSRMMEYPVIKNKLKITGVRKNALAYQKIQEEHGSFSDYIWSFVDKKSIINERTNFRDCPPWTDISEAMRKSLKKYGFTFV